MTNTEDQETLSRRAVLATGAAGLAGVAGLSTATASTEQASSTQESSTTRVATQSSGYGTGGYGEGPYGGGTNTNPFPNGIPGVGTNQPPTNADGDPQLEDVNGDGTANFDDAIALAFADFNAINNGTAAQVNAVDFDNNGTVNFDDAIALAFQV